MIQNQIRHYRRQKGLTLAQLGQRIGTTPQSVSRLETGVMKLSMDWVEKIAEALDVPPHRLIGGEAKHTMRRPFERLDFENKTDIQP